MKKFPELTLLKRLAKTAAPYGRVNTEGTVKHRDQEFPLYSFSFGCQDPNIPVVAFVGGVHGLERIGTKVVLAYLQTFVKLLQWDSLIQQALSNARVVFYPLVNPGGMYFRMRSNPNGVDLMRNAPVEAEQLPKLKLLAGHRLSPRLPWYRGGEEMEVESKALCSLIKRELWPASRAISVDVHSGYGTLDRFWFPYAKTTRPFAHLAEVVALKRLLDRTYPNHVYCVEPQATQYTASGDLWDYLYDLHQQEVPDRAFIPFSLEMGSWIWVKKNPKQLLSVLGAFNPIIPHRLQRILRRHLYLFDFLLRACLSAHWADLYDEKKQEFQAEGMKLWFPNA